MRDIDIVAYEAIPSRKSIKVNRAFNGSIDSIETKEWLELVNFLTEDKGLAQHICWNLPYFASSLFDLLPINEKSRLLKGNRIIYKGVKVFYVEKMLGITYNKPVNGNICEHRENNFYDIQRWLADGLEKPDLETLEQYGIDILDGLEKLGIYPERLVSPISVWMKNINPDTLPTIYNFPEQYLDVMDYADGMCKYEWRKTYKKKPKSTFYYDLTSAYPYFISELPDTRHGTISTKRGNHQWGIVKGRYHDTTGLPSPIDKNARYFTTEELDWIDTYHTGTYDIEDGYYFNFNDGKPYKPIIDKLIIARQTDDAMVNLLAKRIAQGISGKLDQYNRDGSWGDLYNPILAAMVRSRCRLAVGIFIYDNDLVDSLISVAVDGVKSLRDLDIPEKSNAGEWRKQIK